MIRPQTFAQLRPSVAKPSRWRYGSPRHIADNGRRGPINVRRYSAHHPIAGAFFVPAMSCYGGCAWEGFGPAGLLTSRSANPRTVATSYRVAAVGGGSDQTLGASPMRHVLTLNPSKSRAAAHRAMALAALHADSSLSVRLKRYNAQMAKARALEVLEVAL